MENKKGGDNTGTMESRERTVLKTVCINEIKSNKQNDDEQKEKKIPFKKDALESKGITPELVAMELYNVYSRCMQETPVMTKDKETGKQVPTGVYQFDARCALKALQLLGDAVGLFKDRSSERNEGCTYEEFLKSGGYDYEF